MNMNDLIQNTNDGLTSDEAQTKPNEPAECVRSMAEKGLFFRFRSLLFCLIAVVYILTAVISGSHKILSATGTTILRAVSRIQPISILMTEIHIHRTVIGMYS